MRKLEFIRCQLQPDPVCEQMRDALAGMTRYAGDHVAPGDLIGNYLKKMAGRVFDGLRLDSVKGALDHDKGTIWQVVPC